MKIEKEIVDIKTKNYEVQKNIKTISANTNKVALINTFNFINSYLAEQKTGYYAKFYRLVRELTELSEHFAAEANNNLIKTDYEVILSKIFL
jgi:ferritin